MIAHGGTDEERLLVLASLAAPTEPERADLVALSRRSLDWAGLAELAEINAVAPMVFRRLSRDDLLEAMPVAVRDGLHAVSAAVEAVNDRRRAAAVELLARLDAEGVQCVVLKGMLFALELYADPGYKRMNDIDILIRLEDATTVMNVYRDLGMFSSADVLGSQARVKPHRSHHLPSFASRDGALVVGTHWGLITPLAPYAVDYPSIWSRVRPIDFYGVPAWAMSAEDNLHHLCIHLPYYKTGVRELADIWNLVRHNQEGLDVDLLTREIDVAGTHNLVFHALGLVNRLVPHPITTQLVAESRRHATRWYRYDTSRKTRDVHALLRSRSVHTSHIEKAYTRFNATDSFAEKRDAFSSLWGNLLRVPADEAAKMSSLRNPSAASLAGARVAAPYRLTRVFQRDLGRWLFFAALLKTIIDLAASAVPGRRSGAGGSDRNTLEHFAASVGLTTADLHAILDSQE